MEECDCNEGYGYSEDCGRCHGTGIVKPEMDKIREEFEKWYEEQEIKPGYNVRITALLAYKSRDKEVLALTSRVAVAEGANEELKAEIKVLENVIQNKSEENKKLKCNYLGIRDALILREIDEAYHLLYEMADPEFKSNHPWAEWEALKDGE